MSISYPTDNCNSTGTATNPQDIYASLFLNHGAVQGINNDYLNSTLLAQQFQKPFIMFETSKSSIILSGTGYLTFTKTRLLAAVSRVLVTLSRQQCGL